MITPIPNQPIRLRNTNEIDASCECTGQSYCQLVGMFDGTQFQIRSSNLVSNGDFTEDLTGWNVYESITLEIISVSNVSFGGDCDGSITVSASGGTGPYTYSIEGTIFQGSGTFTGLCEGNYYAIAKDTNGNEGSILITISQNVDCSLYEGVTIQDLIDEGITLGQLYNCTLDNLQP